MLNISSTNEKDITEIYGLSLTGSLVYSSSYFVENINLTALTNGIYILVLEDKGVRKIKKIIKN